MKYALVIGNSRYADPKLSQLKTPEADSRELAKVLKAKKFGCFDEVALLINQTESKTRRTISSFLTNKKPDDLVLLYFSGHGVLDDRGGLFLALKDTQYRALNATAISSSFISYEMDNCRSRQQILILDCCHSGAFGRGTKGTQKIITESTFAGSGSGRIVLTASDATQFAFEGDQVIAKAELSLFTHFLLEGLKTGKADKDNDGKVSLDEWYDYVHIKITQSTPKQVPHKWSYRQQGDVIIARNPFADKRRNVEKQPKSIQLRAMLDQKQLEYRRHKLLLDSKELAIIANELVRTKLELREDDRRLLLLSAVANRGGQRWIAINDDKRLEWLREAYRDENSPYEVRLGAIRFLGEQDDMETYNHLVEKIGQNSQAIQRGVWFDLLAQYLYHSVRQHDLPISLRKSVFLRLVKIGLKESAEARAFVSVNIAKVALFCSFFASLISLFNQTMSAGAIVVSIILLSIIGVILGVLFAQALITTEFITRKWLLLMQLSALAGIGSVLGAGLFIIITAHAQVWFMGGVLGITQAILSRIRNKVLPVVWIFITLVFVFAYSAFALAGKEFSLGYVFSACLFSGFYFYFILQVKQRSLG